MRNCHRWWKSSRALRTPLKNFFYESCFLIRVKIMCLASGFPTSASIMKNTTHVLKRRCKLQQSKQAQMGFPDSSAFHALFILVFTFLLFFTSISSVSCRQIQQHLQDTSFSYVNSRSTPKNCSRLWQHIKIIAILKSILWWGLCLI